MCAMRSEEHPDALMSDVYGGEHLLRLFRELAQRTHMSHCWEWWYSIKRALLCVVCLVAVKLPELFSRADLAATDFTKLSAKLRELVK